jgi:hypothetical protein
MENDYERPEPDQVKKAMERLNAFLATDPGNEELEAFLLRTPEFCEPDTAIIFEDTPNGGPRRAIRYPFPGEPRKTPNEGESAPVPPATTQAAMSATGMTVAEVGSPAATGAATPLAEHDSAVRPGDAKSGVVVGTLRGSRTTSGTPRRDRGTGKITRAKKPAPMGIQKPSAPVPDSTVEVRSDVAGQLTKAKASPAAEPVATTNGARGDPLSEPLPPGEYMNSEEARILLRYPTLNAFHQALRRDAIPRHQVRRRLLFVRSELDAYLAAPKPGPKGG